MNQAVSRKHKRLYFISYGTKPLSLMNVVSKWGRPYYMDLASIVTNLFTRSMRQWSAYRRQWRYPWQFVLVWITLAWPDQGGTDPLLRSFSCPPDLKSVKLVVVMLLHGCCELHCNVTKIFRNHKEQKVIVFFLFTVYPTQLYHGSLTTWILRLRHILRLVTSQSFDDEFLRNHKASCGVVRREWLIRTFDLLWWLIYKYKAS